MPNTSTKMENAIGGQSIRQVRPASRTRLIQAGWVALIVFVSAFAPTKAFAQAVPIGPFTEAFTDTSPCTGESFSGTAKTYMLEYTKIGATSTHFTFRLMSHGEALTTLTSVKYVANLENTVEFDVAFGAAAEATTVLGTVFARQGNTAISDIPTSTGDDFVSNLTTHFTINANGVVTADFSRGPFKCTQ